MQDLLGLLPLLVGEVVSVHCDQVIIEGDDVASFDEFVLIDLLGDDLVYHVVRHFKLVFHELLQDFGAGNLVDNPVGVEPLDKLHLNLESSGPVGGKLQIVGCLVTLSEVSGFDLEHYPLVVVLFLAVLPRSSYKVELKGLFLFFLSDFNDEGSRVITFGIFDVEVKVSKRLDVQVSVLVSFDLHVAPIDIHVIAEVLLLFLLLNFKFIEAWSLNFMDLPLLFLLLDHSAVVLGLKFNELFDFELKCGLVELVNHLELTEESAQPPTHELK